MKRYKITLTEKQIDTLLGLIHQEHFFHNSAARQKHLESLNTRLVLSTIDKNKHIINTKQIK
mgnify:CR=1 FL=1|tara:strand:- start:2062 stop:2247 length:186 start_codon:yes stop_codon:yes gene_type:complete